MNVVFLDLDDQRGDPRVQAVREIMTRIATLEGNGANAVDGVCTDAVEVLNRLSGAGALVQDVSGEETVDIRYAPTWGARQAVYDAQVAPGFDEKILKKHRAAFRRSDGALFRFPLESGEGSLEAFITDWSPFPAACAVAVYRDHPITAGMNVTDGTSFTGRFARHPLTGDLLPVWVAPFVRPDFGTGVVVVNPAHDGADLELARRIGLPVRFGLAETQPTGDPSTWPIPPVAKTGLTTRTGAYDGLGIGEARQVYLAELTRHGNASLCVDRSLGTYPLASVNRATGSTTSRCARCRVLQSQGETQASAVCARCGELASPVGIQPSNLLSLLLNLLTRQTLHLVCPATEVERSLLFLRLLWQDLCGAPLALKHCIVLQKANEGGTAASPEELALAVAVAAPPNEVAVVKSQLIDQVRAFRGGCQKLLDAAQSRDLDTPSHENVRPDFTRAKTALGSFRFNEAFAVLYGLQKSMCKDPDEVSADSLSGFLTLAHVLSGSPVPSSLRLSDIWSRIC